MLMEEKLIELLQEKETATISEAAIELGTEISYISAIAKKLENKNIVLRSRNRIGSVWITTIQLTGFNMPEYENEDEYSQIIEITNLRKKIEKKDNKINNLNKEIKKLNTIIYNLQEKITNLYKELEINNSFNYSEDIEKIIDQKIKQFNIKDTNSNGIWLTKYEILEMGEDFHELRKNKKLEMLYPRKKRSPHQKYRIKD